MRRMAIITTAAAMLGIGAIAPAASAKSHQRVYFAEDPGTVSTSLQGPVDLGGPSLRIKLPHHAQVSFFVSYEGQTGLSTDGVDRAGVFAEVVDPIDFPAGTLPAVGMTPNDDAFHLYTTANAGGGVKEYAATPGWHTYALEYSEVPVLGIGGSVGTFPPAFYQDRQLTVTVTK